MTSVVGEVEYEVVSLDDGSFGVTIREGTMIPRTVTGFASQTEAESWVFQELEQTPDDEAEGLPRHL